MEAPATGAVEPAVVVFDALLTDEELAVLLDELAIDDVDVTDVLSVAAALVIFWGGS